MNILRNIHQRCIFVFQISLLGDGFLAKVHVFYTALTILIRERFGMHPQRIVVHLRLHGQSVVFHGSGIFDELGLCKEICIDEEYAIPESISPKKILDLGANVGMSMMYFATKFPDAAIVSVEPDPSTYEVLKKNAVQFPQVTVYNAAVAREEGELTFYRHKNRHVSSSFFRRSDEDEEIIVKTRAFKDLIKDGVDVLKIDVEGEEFRILRDFDDWNKIGVITGETHEDLVDENVRYDLMGQLEEHFTIEYQSGCTKKDRAVFVGVQK